jgi:hypothetical protein
MRVETSFGVIVEILPIASQQFVLDLQCSPLCQPTMREAPPRRQRFDLYGLELSGKSFACT